MCPEIALQPACGGGAEGEGMKKLTVALLFFCSCSASHAQECTPPADQYTGILFDDGRCFPWPKKLEKFKPDGWSCTPELKGRLESALPKIVNGEFVSTKECIPNELQRGPYPPRSTSLDDLKDEIDELKHEIDRLKSERN
jgi:hypothetical protein